MIIRFWFYLSIFPPTIYFFNATQKSHFTIPFDYDYSVVILIWRIEGIQLSEIIFYQIRDDPKLILLKDNEPIHVEAQYRKSIAGLTTSCYDNKGRRYTVLGSIWCRIVHSYLETNILHKTGSEPFTVFHEHRMGINIRLVAATSGQRFLDQRSKLSVFEKQSGFQLNYLDGLIK